MVQRFLELLRVGILPETVTMIIENKSKWDFWAVPVFSQQVLSGTCAHPFEGCEMMDTPRVVPS